MKLKTEISFPNFAPQLIHEGNYVFTGSCFSENVGRWLQHLQFKAEVNPTGIVYNPLSIAEQFKAALSGKQAVPESTEASQGRFVNTDYHSAFSGASREEAATLINRASARLAKGLKNADILFITFGTAVVFKRRSNGLVVNNCHKLPSDLFEQAMPEETFFFDALHTALAEVRSVNPAVKFCFTVSPVRHLRHGAVTNARSKARLLRLCEMLCEAFENSVYLPVYEFVNDELRDYRFFRHDDLIHLNEAGLEMLRERLHHVIIDSACRPLLQKIEKLQRMEGHNMFHPESRESRDFMIKRESLRAEIEAGLGRRLISVKDKSNL